MSKREKDFIEAGIQYRFAYGTPMAIGGGHFAEMTREMNRTKPFEAGAEHGYQYARKNLWHDAQGDNVPEYGREVIVIGRDGKVFYGHRPDPKEYVRIDGEVCHAKTYGKNGWNWPDIALWLDVEIPHEMVDKIVTAYFKENKQPPRKEE